ncbi:hypothetical protein L6R52_11730 [Myxococcota bacterium]|nr:hypothetical protein [Myxococcota bacterium]
MRINLPIGDQLQRTIGRIAADPIASQPNQDAKQAADKLELGALPFTKVEAQAITKQLVEALGLQKESDLAQVTQSGCFQKCQNPMDGVVLWSLVIAVQVHLDGCKPVDGCVLPRRKEPLPELGVEVCAGVFVDPQRPVQRDPLVFVFDKIEPSTPDNPTKIYIVNRSDLNNPKPIELPADTMKAKDGKYVLILGDEWMIANKVRAGDVLEIFQTKGKDDSPRQSPSTYARINKEGPGRHVLPRDIPQDVVGNVQLRAEFEHVLDPRPAAIRAENMDARLDGGLFRLQRRGDQPAVEPFSKVIVENLRTGEKSEPIEVDPKGGFAAQVAAQKNDPILVRIVDHSHQFGDVHFERRLTLEAGRESAPMLAVNPTLGIDGPPTAALDRIGLVDGCAALAGTQAVTPGSLVTITRSGHPEQTITAIADADGSFRAKMPFDVHAEDVFDLRVESPFTRIEKPEAWQARAFASARLEINENASLDVAAREGRVLDHGGAVKKHDNADRVDSGTPYLQDMRAKLKSFGFRFEPYNPNTGNSCSIGLVADTRAKSMARLALENGTVVVTLTGDVRGGWHEGTKEGHANVVWGSNNSADNWAWNNPHVNAYRQLMVGKKAGEQVPVIFKDEAGKQIAEGMMNVRVAREGTGSGAGGYQDTRYVDLDMATVRFA